MCAWASLTTMPQSRRQPSDSVIEPATISASVPCCCSQSETRVCSADSRFLRLDVRFPGKSRRLGTGKTPSGLRRWALTAAIAISMTFGCGTPHAILNFTAPSTATAGSPFTVTVTVTIDGRRDTIINSYISFTSSDPAAVLPSQYRFTAADAGSHTWTNGFTLLTPGNQTISATIYDAPGINGTANVTVSQ
jgi:hypothetical protein